MRAPPSRLLSTFVALLGLLVLAACGGGGGGGAGVGGAEDGVGFFRGSTVEGLTYETPSQSGQTDAEGRFFYEPGEDITFRIGGTVLGTTPGKAVVTPLDLAPGAVAPSRNGELHDLVFTQEPSPESRFLNLLVFLQTIDADDNLDNGIQVPSQLGDLLDGVQVSFDRGIPAFDRHPALRGLIRDGLQAGLWGGVGRPIRNMTRALDHFYAHTDLVHAFERQIEDRSDSNGDTIADSIRTNTYSADELTKESASDQNADGVIDSRGRTTFTESGARRSTSTDSDADGTADVVRLADLNDNDQVVRASVVTQGVVTEATLYTLDALGMPERKDFDRDGDGTFEDRTTYTYNEQGLEIRREIDNGIDGQIDLISTFTWYDNGVRRTSTHDTDVDGNADSYYVHDRRGRRTLYERDDDSNGTVDRRETTTYDDEARTTTTGVDTDADGNADEIRRLVRDELGRVILQETDEGANGSVESRITTTYLPDRVITDFDDDADGTPDKRNTYELSAGGNRTLYLVDEGVDGVIERRTIKVFEPGSAWTSGSSP